jgi:CRISPR-associated protein Cas1
MKTLYLTEQGSIVRKESRRLIVSKNDVTIAEVSTIGLDAILIFGNIQLTPQAITLILEQGIDVSFLSIRGKFRGRLISPESKNVFLRIAQYERYLDDNFQLDFAIAIVKAKITNGINLIKRYAKNYPNLDFSKELSELYIAIEKLENMSSVPSIRGVEGYSSSIYFCAFRKMLREGFEFLGRDKRPPPDPINALLSLGYTLITNEIASILFALGFDLYIGYYHGINYGRPSLALDMVEEFRHSIIDSFILYLVNKRIVSPDDFEEDEEGIFLKPQTLKEFLKAYDKRMTDSSIKFSDSRQADISYRSLLWEQAYKLSKSIQQREPYQPFIEG